MERNMHQSTTMLITYAVVDVHTIEGIVVPKLCHGNNVVEVRSLNDDVTDCDAVITSDASIALGIKTADCAPICFSDGTKIGIAHVGWRGLCLGLIEKTLKEFNERSLEVVIGPRLDTFPIQRDSCYNKIVEMFGERFFRYEGETITFLFKEAIASRLPTDAIFDTRSTGEDYTLPSHRRDKTSTRLLTVVEFK